MLELAPRYTGLTNDGLKRAYAEALDDLALAPLSLYPAASFASRCGYPADALPRIHAG